MKLVYTEDAVADLKRLRDFVAEHDPGAANSIAHELVNRISRLTEFPGMGSPVELAPDPDSVRDMVFGKYIVRYSLHPSTLIVLRVWHQLEDH